MHILSPLSISEASYGVVLYNSVLAIQYGSEADDSDSEDDIFYGSESYVTGSYLSG